MKLLNLYAKNLIIIVAKILHEFESKQLFSKTKFFQIKVGNNDKLSTSSSYCIKLYLKGFDLNTF